MLRQVAAVMQNADDFDNARRYASIEEKMPGCLDAFACHPAAAEGQMIGSRAGRHDLRPLFRAGPLWITREVTQRLQLRHAPELRFVYDDGQDNTSRVEQLLAEIDHERRQK